MSVLETAIGWLAPAECLGCGTEGPALCLACVGSLQRFGERCWRCNRLSPGCRTCESCRHAGGPAHVFIYTHYEGVAAEVVRTYKFDHLRTAAQSLAAPMAAALRSYSGKDYLITPVPTATSRTRARGFDHSELLAKTVAARLGLPRASLLRRLDQSHQVGSTREDRLKQIRGNLAIKSGKLVADQDILLIDDVLTTGGTLIAATQALKAAGARQVDALIFAKRL